MDEFDPASRDAPPSRHLIESDSEDEADQGILGGSTSHPSARREQHSSSSKVSIVDQNNASSTRSDSSAQGKDKTLILLIGAIGEAYTYTRAQQNDSTPWTSAMAVMVDDVQQGAVHVEDDGTAVALFRLDAAALARQDQYAYMMAALLERLKPARVVLVDAYNVALYLANEDERRAEENGTYGNGEAPIRYLQGSQSGCADSAMRQAGLQPFATPNYITGLSASALCETNARCVPATMLLLPQEHHTMNPHLHIAQQMKIASTDPDSESHPHSSVTAFDAKSDALDAHIAQQIDHLLSFSKGRNATDATEGEAIYEFLDRRRAKARKMKSSDISAMYM